MTRPCAQFLLTVAERLSASLAGRSCFPIVPKKVISLVLLLLTLVKLKARSST